MTPKQRAFAREYAVDHNATQAAIRAGYATRSAAQQGERLLRNDDVLALIEALDQQHAERTDLEAERVLSELQLVAFAGPDDLAAWPNGKLSDKLRALERLAEVVGLIGRHAGTSDTDDVPGVIVVPSSASREEWIRKHGVVEIQDEVN